MKWPLYEEAESFTKWFQMNEELSPIIVSVFYFLYLMAAFSWLVYRPIKYLKEKKPKENFWSQYDTGGI